MDNTLSLLKISRDKKHNLGKRIGQHLWIHKDYILDLMPLDKFTSYKSMLPESHLFNILRIDLKGDEIAFIFSPDFDSANEPIVGDSIKVNKINNEFHTTLTKQPKNNPTIYHHKWLFVKDDYSKFNVESSKERSIAWKTKLGVNKALTSRIGRIEFWNQWLNDNNLVPRI